MSTLSPTLVVPRDSWREALLLLVFTISGASALMYQVCWQRLLFGAFGVDIESITIIVSTFMLGLGCGALIGGRLADKFSRHIIELFVACEVGIGVFGLISPWALPAVGNQFVDAPIWGIAVVNFGLVLIPATLMGSTLPMLVAYLYQRSGNVGVSIGRLYQANTLGAAGGALGAGVFLFMVLPIDRVIQLAALGNFTVAALTYFGVRRR